MVGLNVSSYEIDSKESEENLAGQNDEIPKEIFVLAGVVKIAIFEKYFLFIQSVGFGLCWQFQNDK